MEPIITVGRLYTLEQGKVPTLPNGTTGSAIRK